MRSPRVFLADDHRIVLDGLVRAIGSRVEVVGTADTVDSCRLGVAKTTPEVVVLDLYFEHGACIDLIRELSVPPRSMRVLVLSGAADQASAARMAFSSGALGFVGKADSTERLMAAISRVHGGGVYVDVELVSALATHLKGSHPIEYPSERAISEREGEVFSLLGAGLSAKEIAARLFISPVTVRTHLARLQKKLGCGSRAELVVKAVRQVRDA